MTEGDLSLNNQNSAEKFGDLENTDLIAKRDSPPRCLLILYGLLRKIDNFLLAYFWQKIYPFFASQK